MGGKAGKESVMSRDTNLRSITSLGMLCLGDQGYCTYDLLFHPRFFMDYLWRLSDEEDEGNYSFLERTLVPRLRL